MMHVVDTDDELMWTDDHNPPTPTSQWKPGQTIEYTRTIFVPVYPYVGDASIQLGLYSTQNQKRLTLSGEDAGQRSYKVARLQLQPQTENVFMLFKDGWNPAEVAEHNSQVSWQWTKKSAVIQFKNPKQDCTFYLDVDNPGSVFHEPQHVEVSLDGTVVKAFDLTPAQQVLYRIPFTAAQLGTADMDEIRIAVDKTFVPATMNASNSHDPRELGVRVFHAFVDAR
jgi:archaellum component FlaF (FlaF/FlaG flagellin family)